MPANSVEIVITARDETSRALEQVRGTFAGLGQDIERGAKGGTTSLELLEGVLRKIGGSSSSASAAFQTLASAMQSPLGAAGSLTSALGAYGVALNRAADEQARFQRALNSMNVQTVRGELSRVNDELNRMSDIGNRIGNESKTWTGALQSFIARFQAIPQVLGEWLLGKPTPESQQAQAQTMAGGLIGAQEGAAQTQIRAAMANIEQRRLLFEMQRRLNAGDVAGAQALRQQLAEADRRGVELEVQAMRQSRLQSPERIGMMQQGIPTTAYDATTALEERRIRAQSQIELERQRIARDEQLRALSEKGIDDRFNRLQKQAEFEKEAAEEQWALEQELARQKDAQLADQREASAAYLRDRENQLQEEQRIAEENFKVYQVQEDFRKGQREAERQDQFEIFDIIRQRAAILGDLTPTLQAQLALAEAENLKRQEGLSDAQKATIDARAQLAVLQQMVALDPLAGLRRGFTVVAQAAQQWGSELERVAYETSATMARFFDDSLFNLFTGRKGEDVGRQFAEGLLRSVTGLFSRQLTGYISSIFAQILPRGVGAGAALYGGSAVDVYGLLQGGAGGGGGGFNLMGLGGTASGINTLSGLYGGPSIGLTGGGGYLSSLAATPISSLTLTGGTGSAFGATYGGLSAEYLGATSGLTVGGAATGVLAAAALGYTIYSGLSQEQTAANIAYNAVAGAVSGAIVGAVIGTVVPGIGNVLGAVIGAVVGGAAAGGTTGLKAARGPSPNERSKKIAEQATANLSDAIDKASSVEDLAVIFNLPWAPHGEVQIGTFYGGAAYSNGPEGLKATPALMIMPEFLTSLSIRTGPTGATALRQDLIDKFRSKRDELVGILSNIPFGILESDRSIGLTRRTYQPLTALYGMQPGRSRLVTSTEYLRRDLGAEDQTIAFVVDRLREFSVRKDVDLTRQDFLYR